MEFRFCCSCKQLSRHISTYGIEKITLWFIGYNKTIEKRSLIRRVNKINKVITIAQDVLLHGM